MDARIRVRVGVRVELRVRVRLTASFFSAFGRKGHLLYRSLLSLSVKCRSLFAAPATRGRVSRYVPSDAESSLGC